MNATPTDAQDLQDMERLAAGQDAGLDSLMERYAPRLLRYALRLLGDEHEAEEVAQEAFVRVYRKHDQFDPKQRFSTWVYAIATNLARDHLRRRQRHAAVLVRTETTEPNDQPWPPAQDPSRDPRESLEAQETGLLVRKAILALPEDLRIPVILSEYDGLSHVEIGEVLNCTPKAIEMRIYRARQALRTSLASLLEPGPGQSPRARHQPENLTRGTAP